MNRQAKHLEARNTVAKRLRRLGLNVVDAERSSGYDLLVSDHIRVALRVAYPGRYAHSVKVAGKRYAYDYPSWTFNFHRHGRLDLGACDVFVCIAKERGSGDEIFIIPAAVVSGPTFSLHGAGTPYRGRYAGYRNHWGSIAESDPSTPSSAEVA